MNRVIVAVGSNFNPVENIAKARTFIQNKHPLVKVSRLRETRPVGDISLSNFLNGVFLIETEWNQHRLKSWLKELEVDLGRVSGKTPSGFLPIDLDIVVWNGDVVDPDVYERDFLREAVLEVWPDLKLQK